MNTHHLYSRGRRPFWILLSAVLLLVASLPAPASASVGRARANLYNQSGQPVGWVSFLHQKDGTVLVRASVSNMPPGFHGMHVHSVGMCVAPFTSASSHFNPGAASHPGHAADFPVVLVNANGRGEAWFKTDRFTIPQLFDGDGSAVIFHANPDNYANIPADRYDHDPDSTTLGTGDAGSRLACGVIESN